MATQESKNDEKKWKKSNVYTKTGDNGTSSLYTGERRAKNDGVFECLGDVDELSSHIGMAREYCQNGGHDLLNERLEEIQSILMDVGSCIATPPSEKKAALPIPEDSIRNLESWTDEFDSELPPLKNFILASGGFTSCSLHIARTVCRRAERHAWPLVESMGTDVNAAIFLNRLSDFLFVSARWTCFKERATETIYKREKGTKKVEQYSGCVIM